MCIIVLLALACLAMANADEVYNINIVGGEVTTINKYPYAVAMLLSIYDDHIYRQACGGTLLSHNAVMTAGHCFAIYGETDQWRMRLGSTQANNSGTVYEVKQIIRHPEFSFERDALPNHDVAIVKPKVSIVYVPNFIQPAKLAGADFVLNDNVEVTAIGWGRTDPSDYFTFNTTSVDLREVKLKTVNQATCQERYSKAPNNYNLTEFMLCIGLLDVGGKDQCQGDSGSPLIYNGYVVGICSFGINCATAYYPTINSRVSNLSQWALSYA